MKKYAFFKIYDMYIHKISKCSVLRTKMAQIKLRNIGSNCIKILINAAESQSHVVYVKCEILPVYGNILILRNSFSVHKLLIRTFELFMTFFALCSAFVRCKEIRD